MICSTCQNERELKRERRKQSNRESARRSRLRKQVQHRFSPSFQCRIFYSQFEDLYNNALIFLSCHVIQAETEELATKVESLTAENSLLKSEVSRLAEKSEKLKLENATLMVQPCFPSFALPFLSFHHQQTFLYNRMSIRIHRRNSKMHK